MITLLGYGKTTKAIAKKFAPGCIVFDDNFKENSTDKFGNLLLKPEKFENYKTDIQIPSPGFPPNHPLIQKSQNLVSEYDFFLRDIPFSIWISGTNGKTTTTQMLEHLLKDKNAQAGGNIGLPLAEMDKTKDIWILESSSFTLHYTKLATPDIYLLLPIKPDHISWHGSFKEYEDAKLSVLFRMKEGSVAIIPKKYENLDTLCHKVTYENEDDLAKKMDIEIEKIEFQSPFLLDSILAMSCEKILFNRIDYKKMNSFKTDRHKLEEFEDKSGRLWVNDSKGTNVDATLEALKRYKNREILLILGGDDKGVSLDRLFDALKPLHVKIYAIGSNSDKITSMSKTIGKEVHNCKYLKDAISLIKKSHTQKSVALLSPAASSLDQFSSYAQRGDEFMELALS